MAGQGVIPWKIPLDTAPPRAYTYPMHKREITETDGVSDQTAIAWSYYEDRNRRYGDHGKHRA